jgi:hypothetical protein
MTDLDIDHASLRLRADTTKPINQIRVTAVGTGTPRAYVYEVLEAPTASAKTISLNHVATLDMTSLPYTLAPTMKYYVVAVSDGGYLSHERLYEAVAVGGNIATFSDPSGASGGGSQIIITMDGTMPA